MPWSKNISRAIKKEAKVYFYDWQFVENRGACFENMLAVSLLSLISGWNELGIGDFDLRYLRNHQGKEVDFLILKNNVPLSLFEAKLKETMPASSGTYFSRLLNIPLFQVVSLY
jgi:predicted AAA+ superfamily ATPase